MVIRIHRNVGFMIRVLRKSHLWSQLSCEKSFSQAAVREKSFNRIVFEIQTYLVCGDTTRAEPEKDCWCDSASILCSLMYSEMTAFSPNYFLLIVVSTVLMQCSSFLQRPPMLSRLAFAFTYLEHCSLHLVSLKCVFIPLLPFYQAALQLGLTMQKPVYPAPSSFLPPRHCQANMIIVSKRCQWGFYSPHYDWVCNWFLRRA